MDYQIKSVHYHVSDATKEFIDKKMKKLTHLKDYISDFDFVINKETHEYIVEAHVHFKWGTITHIKEKDIELYPAIENNFHRLEVALTKEKEKKQDH